MNVLGIETSCDETAIAIVSEQTNNEEISYEQTKIANQKNDELLNNLRNSSKKILSHCLISQIDIHKEFGGVVPEVASRNHLDVIDHVFQKALNDANLKAEDLDVIAATVGPGLIGGVVVGTVFAKTLASALKKPFIAVNHLEGHALVCRWTDSINFPFILFLLSGGHCQILRVNSVGNYDKIGETLDDSLGETFDKVAQLVGLAYPGGPKIEQMAKSGDENRFKFTKPLIDGKSLSQIEKDRFNFSFSGLKTALRMEVGKIRNENHDKNSHIHDINYAANVNYDRDYNDINGKLDVGALTMEERQDICASFQKTVVDILEDRLKRVMKQFGDIKTFVLSGGVSANQYIKNHLEAVCERNSCRLFTPPIDLCTDNGIMIANAALERYRLGLVDRLDISPKARWELEDLKLSAKKI